MIFPEFNDRLNTIITEICNKSEEGLENSPLLGQLVDELAQYMANVAEKGPDRLFVSTVAGYRLCVPNLLPHLVPFSRSHGRQTAFVICKVSEMLDKIASGYEGDVLELGGFCAARNTFFGQNRIRIALGVTGSKRIDIERAIVEETLKQLRNLE